MPIQTFELIILDFMMEFEFKRTIPSLFERIELSDISVPISPSTQNIPSALDRVIWFDYISVKPDPTPP